MSNQKADSYEARLSQLQNSVGAQIREAAPSLLLDLAAGVGGWFAGKWLGRGSLLIGLATLAGGKFLSVRSAMKREEERASKASRSGRMKKLADTVYGDYHIYTGDSPVSALGMGIMIGGATAFISDARQSSDTDKGVWQEMKEDLTYRLYLDKFFKPKEDKQEQQQVQPDAAVSGIGELKYFLAGDNDMSGIDLSELDKLDQQMAQAAAQFQTQQMNGAAPAPQYAADSFNGFSDSEEAVTRIM